MVVVVCSLFFHTAYPAQGFRVYTGHTAQGFIDLFKGEFSLAVLMDRIHRPQWRIAYNFTADCPDEFKQKDKELEGLIAKALRAWIQPLRDHYPDKQFTDDFIFVRQPDMDDCAVPDRPWPELDAGITFACKGDRSLSIATVFMGIRPGNGPWVCLQEALGIVDGDQELIYILMHELGHAFGLADTYVGGGLSIGGLSTGGLAHTMGRQPSSIMADFSFVNSPPFYLSEDDKNGIIWLYKYLHEDISVEDCFFPNYVFEEETYGCRPKHPLIFETKHGTLDTVSKILQDDATLALNAYDVGGMTALHYAVQRTDRVMVELLLAQASIKVNLMNKRKQTPAQLARALGQVHIAKLIETHPTALHRPIAWSDVTLAAVGTLTKETEDASAGVSYTIKITNTGNTDDTFNLSTSGDVNATVSQSVVSLGSGASAEVIVTVSDPTLSTAGTYVVKLTATPQNDTAKTADITTTTTILPIYGVTLAGVGDLTKEIAAAGEPISYTLKITNAGNTTDVIDITTIGDAAATLSQFTVSLSAGASAEVTMTVSTTALSTAGDYAVRVTATSQGDSTQTAKMTTTTTLLPVTPIYRVMFEGDSERTGSTVDVLSGVSYMLTLTNTGNTDDTIVLDSSAEAGIEGSVLGTFIATSSSEQPVSQLEIVLAAGASAEVIFIAAGDFFTKPGTYEIDVTATSHADSTKTAVLTITTTITPVPSDVNADGVVNILDLVKVANQFGEIGDGLVGDVNMDGRVNILDLVKVSSRFGKTQAEIVESSL